MEDMPCAPACLLVLESSGDCEQVTTEDFKVPCSPPCQFSPSCFPGTLCTVGCRGYLEDLPRADGPKATFSHRDVA